MERSDNSQVEVESFDKGPAAGRIRLSRVAGRPFAPLSQRTDLGR
jgi:hypothetical protein